MCTAASRRTLKHMALAKTSRTSYANASGLAYVPAASLCLTVERSIGCVMMTG